VEKLRGLYRYETAPGRWWACAEDANGQRVNMLRRSYEEKAIEPPFLELPIGNGNGKKKRVA
jgi:hypothetical protein